MSQTFPEGRRTPAELPDSEVRQTSNIIYLTPRQMVEATRDYEAGWSPIDEDQSTRDEVFEMIGEYLPWTVCFIVAALIGVWLAVGHS